MHVSLHGFFNLGFLILELSLYLSLNVLSAEICSFVCFFFFVFFILFYMYYFCTLVRFFCFFLFLMVLVGFLFELLRFVATCWGFFFIYKFHLELGVLLFEVRRRD